LSTSPTEPVEKGCSKPYTLDVGGGSRPRGHVCVDLEFKKATSHHLDPIVGEPFDDCERVKATGEALPFKDDSFDKVLMVHSLEHMQNPFSALKEARRVAKEITIVVPNAQLSRADELNRSHLYSWTRWSLINLLEKAGWKPTQLSFPAAHRDVLIRAERI